MSLQKIARRYAVALADVVIARGEGQAVQEELAAWESMISSNPLLKEVLGNPTIAYDQKQRLLEELVSRTRVRPTTANFLRVLLRNQRLTEISEVNRRFAEIMDARSGVASAFITTARPLSEDLKAALHQKLLSVTGKKVRLTFASDEELIGGIVTRIGSTVYDGSIRNQLNEIEQTLTGRQ